MTPSGTSTKDLVYCHVASALIVVLAGGTSDGRSMSLQLVSPGYRATCFTAACLELLFAAACNDLISGHVIEQQNDWVD